MSDKMRRTAPINITFAARENPTATKLTALNTQTRAALSVIEHAIGDIWHQSGDSLLDNHPLYISNLSRTIGSLLNGVLPFNWQSPDVTSVRFYDHIGARYSGKTTGRTLFPPSGGSITVSTAGNLSTLVADGSVNNPGDYYVAPDGEVILFDGFSGTEVVYYTVDVTATPFSNMSDFQGAVNVIPHPSQDAYTGCRILYTNGNYRLRIPPRRPIASHGYDRWLSAAEIADSNNNATNATSTPYRFFLSSAATSTGNGHYTYKMPDIIDDVMSTAGTTLPKGMLYLYDTTTKTIIDDVVFTTVNNVTLQIESATYDFSSYVSTTDVESSYSNSPFLLITVGSSITDVLSQLIKELYSARTAFSNTFLPYISHGDLADNELSYTNTINKRLCRGGKTVGDDHIQYLARIKIQNDAGGARDLNNNAMLDDLTMGGVNSIDGAGTYVNSVHLQSRAIRWGGYTNSFPYTYTASGVRDVTTTCTEPYSMIFTGPNDNAKELVEFYQTDDNEPFVKYNGTSAADQTKSISTVNGDGAVEGPKNYSSTAGWAFEGMVRIDINGTDYWMPYYSADLS